MQSSNHELSDAIESSDTSLAKSLLDDGADADCSRIYNEKKYGLTWFSFQVSKLSIVLMTFAKRMSYRLLIK